MGEEPWRALAETQGGAVSRQQMFGLGLTQGQIRALYRGGRWQMQFPGVYVTHSGPVPERTRVWAAVLYGGAGALAGGRTALWLTQALTKAPARMEICVPAPRQIRAQKGMIARQARKLADRGDYMKSPPRLRIEHALLDVVRREDEVEAVAGLVLGTLQKRLTTAARVRAALATRERQRWRLLLGDLLREFDAGVQSPLESVFFRRVESNHGLPQGVRNQPRVEADGRKRYRDVRYEAQLVVVELDGREAHPESEAFRDMRRDNAVVTAGEVVLRYGWRDVTKQPCLVATEVAEVLIRQGWAGRPRLCGAGCALYA
ncbi:hypothetical protein [Kineosporia sp. NBRC 101677]|uniref:hypothetical protein n=1 Tax=Kineosporia sp. NBRC 101677 TaxID=3032197 RepID=UPI0025564886|nr:hypothetical protein [Kineosporia sp. NBRC 101677]